MKTKTAVVDLKALSEGLGITEIELREIITTPGEKPSQVTTFLTYTLIQFAVNSLAVVITLKLLKLI